MEITVTEGNFEEIVLKAGIPVLVYFRAPWSPSSREIAPAVRTMASENGDHLLVAEINVDENRNVTARFGIRGMPTFLILKDSMVMYRQIGGSIEVLREKVREALL